jgi:hypothetical protein
VVEHPEVFDHVGLLVNEPSSYAGMLFIKSSDESMEREECSSNSTISLYGYRWMKAMRLFQPG